MFSQKAGLVSTFSDRLNVFWGRKIFSNSLQKMQLPIDRRYLGLHNVSCATFSPLALQYYLAEAFTIIKSQSHDLKGSVKLFHSECRHRSRQDSNNGCLGRLVFKRVTYDFPTSVQGAVRALDFCFPSLFPSSFLGAPHTRPSLLRWPLCFTTMRCEVSRSWGAPQSTKPPRRPDLTVQRGTQTTFFFLRFL